MAAYQKRQNIPLHHFHTGDYYQRNPGFNNEPIIRISSEK